MKLYPKKLKTVEDLQKERASLKSKIKQIEAEGILPGLGQKTAQSTEKKGPLSIISDFFFTNPFADIALSLGKPLIRKAGKSASKNLFGIGKELFGGYAKWKAIELGYRWTRRLLKKEKNKQD